MDILLILFSSLRRVVAAGLVARLIIAPFFAHPFDVYAWYVTGKNLLSGAQPVSNFLTPYGYSFFLFAFPAAFVFRFLSSYVGSSTITISSLNPLLNPGALWKVTLVPGPLFDLLVKLPLITSDTLIAGLLYTMAKKHLGDERLALSICALWFLNPMTIWISSGWGMFDTLPALFTVLALFLLLEGRFGYVGVSLALAVAMKYYAIILVLPFLFLAWRRSGRNGALRGAAGFAIPSLGLFLPLLPSVASGFASLAGGPAPPGLHYSGLSFWSAITLFFAGSDQAVTSPLLVSLLIIAGYAWMSRRHPCNGLFVSSLYFALPIVALLTAYRFVGENYFVWLLPFASILAVKGRAVKALYWFVSLLALLSSVTDALLPYYMLPMAPWIGNLLVSALAAAAPYRVAPQGSVSAGVSIGKLFLSAIGVSSTTALVLTTFSWMRLRV